MPSDTNEPEPSDPDESQADSWLTKIKNVWNLLVQAAVWISAFAASMLLPPVTGVIEGETTRLLKYTVFIIAILLGISFIIAGVLNKRKHRWFWIVLTVLFLAGSIISINRNYDLNNTLVCNCNGQNVIRGTAYKQPEVVTRFYPRGVDCSILCVNFVNSEGKVVPEKVWSEASINDSRRTLFLSYLVCFPLVALTIISVVQAIYCWRKLT